MDGTMVDEIALEQCFIEVSSAFSCYHHSTIVPYSSTTVP
jgi:hypothetical protein